jgi:hypothetical protein
MTVFNSIKIGVTSLSFCTIAASSGVAFAAARSNIKTESSCKSAGQQAAPEGFVYIERKQMTELNSLPLDLLADARRDFRDDRYARAAQDIHTASLLMRIQSKGNVKKGRLEQTADRLENLSERVAQDQIKTPAILDEELTQAAEAEAEHHYFRATDEWAKRMTSDVGTDLAASVNAVEKVTEWSGAKIVRSGDDAVTTAESISKKIATGGKWTEDEIGKGIVSLGTELDVIGKKIEPRAKE